MGKKLTVKKRMLVDEGIYAAKVKTVEKKEGKYGSYYRVTFKITDEEFEGKSVNGNCLEEIEVGNKTYKWVNALLGRELEVDEEFDMDDLVGKPCKIAIEHNSTDEGTFAKVASLYKRKKKGDDDEEEEEPKKKKHDEEEEEDDEPKKKKHDDDEDEDDEPKKKKHDDDEEEEDDDEPKKKKKDDDEEEDDDEPKKKKKDDDEDEEFK